MTRTFTGRHIAIILVAFFGVVIAVNIAMAWLASSTFGGLVVQNSYVASQKFNSWLEEAREQKALGWTLEAARTPDHHVLARLTSNGQPMADARLTALIRHPLGRAPQRTLQFRALAPGRYESVETLPQGRWIVHLHAATHGRQLDQLVDLP